ncbi:CPBP family intramembrane glutamic endopeptidase [Nocardioides sp. SYSU D00038]|uniref:CPBP family intramembrane glutamic endopeptidase n=1 Tax=Nocardioides sp. SYSU D00038 TaxID=2812554 RepID=UPI001967C30F|nr:type II CAAX endopeptidase family protein [Nocardioides sp. SYSU D00038]
MTTTLDTTGRASAGQPADRPTSRWRDVVRRRPLLVFFVLANVASWVAWTPYVLSQNGLGVLDLRFPGGPGVSQLTGVLPGAYLGPIGAALLVTAVADGRAGLRAWAARLWRWRVGWRWYAGVLLGVPAAMVLATMALGADASTPSPFVLVALVPGLVVQMITTGLAEEPGWRDFALPRLQHRFGPLGAAAVLGPAWGVWHLPLFLTEWGGWPDVAWWRPVEFVAFCVVFNVVMTWVFNRTHESLPMAMLLHVSVNNFASMAWSDVFPGRADEHLQHAILLASTVAAAVLLLTTRGRLGYVRE